VTVRQRLRSTNPRLLAGGTVLLLLAAASVVGPWFTADPAEILDPRNSSLLPPFSSCTHLRLHDGTTLVVRDATVEGAVVRALHGGRAVTIPLDRVATLEHRFHLLGTDTLGRDVLSRLLHGGRISLAVGASALLLALGIGIAAGMAAGWLGGAVDAVLMRLVDALLAIPTVFLLLFLAAVFRPGLVPLVLILGLSAWTGVARLVRGQILSLKEREFVLAARGLGVGPVRMALTHLLPNAITPLAQDGALLLCDLILLEASLSFLGLGVPPPHPSWGNMVAEGENVLLEAWWLALIPGAAVALTVMAAAVLADGLSETARGVVRDSP
jgi:peptide/nickel transport system permease protein